MQELQKKNKRNQKTLLGKKLTLKFQFLEKEGLHVPRVKRGGGSIMGYMAASLQAVLGYYMSLKET